jgi:CheY-like chemotaxis protein
MNLVSNAAEALVHGGTVSIASENRYIDKPISGYDDIEEGDYVTLTVSDTGIGIAAADIERIFEPFYTKKAMGRSGTGLGMAVVWGTVKDHKGYIDVQSTEGQGTRFFIYLPASRQPSSRAAPRRSMENYQGRGESLLIIDDVKDQRRIATGILTKLGYRVESVSSGEEAVEYLKTRKVDLLILDMIMDPGIDGLETYRQILKVHPAQKAIIASGFSESERVKEAQKLGAGAYVKKPYLVEKMAVAVRQELDR